MNPQEYYNERGFPVSDQQRADYFVARFKGTLFARGKGWATWHEDQMITETGIEFTFAKRMTEEWLSFIKENHHLCLGAYRRVVVRWGNCGKISSMLRLARVDLR